MVEVVIRKDSNLFLWYLIINRPKWWESFAGFA